MKDLKQIKQETFDTVAKHLLTQNQKSITRRPVKINMINCAYRGDNGLKCAVGILIPDELYSPEMETKTAPYVINDHGDLYNHIVKVPLDESDKSYLLTFLYVLQFTHDNFPVNEWKKRLHQISKANKLSSKVLDEFTD